MRVLPFLDEAKNQIIRIEEEIRSEIILRLPKIGGALCICLLASITACFIGWLYWALLIVLLAGGAFKVRNTKFCRYAATRLLRLGRARCTRICSDDCFSSEGTWLAYGCWC